MKFSDILNIFEEVGIAKDNLEKVKFRDLPPTFGYQTKLNKKGRYLYIYTFRDEPQYNAWFEFGMVDNESEYGKMYSGYAVRLVYEDSKFASITHLDETLSDKLIEPNTNEEEVEFIKQVIRIYKSNL
jgi:hypothetical protein